MEVSDYVTGDELEPVYDDQDFLKVCLLTGAKDFCQPDAHPDEVRPLALQSAWSIQQTALL